MPLPVIDNCFRVTWNFQQYLGVRPAIVQHFLTATADVVDLGEAIWGNTVDGIFGPMHTSFEPQSITIIPLDGTSASTEVARPAGVDTELCNGSGEILPAVAALFSLRTNTRGPQGRGRSYIGPICESTCSDGVLDGGWIVDTQNAWNTWLGLLASSDPSIGICVASYAHDVAHLATSGLCRRVLATQRRRQDQLR
jgi:hypothetical protein